MPRSQRDDIRFFSFAGETIRQRRQGVVGAAFVFTGRVVVQAGAEQPVEQYIAGMAVFIGGIVDPLFQLDVAFKP